MLASELQCPYKTDMEESSGENIGKIHELLKDPMLEKLVLLVVALFSIATETRLCAMKKQS